MKKASGNGNFFPYGEELNKTKYNGNHGDGGDAIERKPFPVFHGSCYRKTTAGREEGFRSKLVEAGRCLITDEAEKKVEEGRRGGKEKKGDREKN